MKTPILGGSYELPETIAACNRMINLYPEVINEGGDLTGYLKKTPGLRLIANLSPNPVRGMREINGEGFFVVGETLYSMDSSETIREIARGIVGEGPVYMTDNGTQLAIYVNPEGYIYNTLTGAFAQIIDPDYPGASSGDYLDGYFVFTEPKSQKFWVSQLLDGNSVDPTDFASAEASPDNLVLSKACNRELWLFGEKTTEVWYNSGDVDFPFARIQGAFIEIGCAAANSAVKIDNSIFWVGKSERGGLKVYRTVGYQAARVSNHAIETAIGKYTDVLNAEAYGYEENGHIFYVVSFPLDRKTWCYDITTQQWHERAYFDNGVFTRHRARCHMFLNGKNYVGDWQNGKIYELSQDVYDDAGDYIKWLRSWRALPTGQNNYKRNLQHELQIVMQVGIAEPGTNPPQVMLRWSDNAGKTWSNEHFKPLGIQGEYDTRVIWRRLGSSDKLRIRVYEVSGTDPIPVAITDAELSLEPLTYG